LIWSTRAFDPMGFLLFTRMATFVTQLPPSHSYVIGGVSGQLPARSRRPGLLASIHVKIFVSLISLKVNFYWIKK
jgi:hypothetical protein